MLQLYQGRVNYHQLLTERNRQKWLLGLWYYLEKEKIFKKDGSNKVFVTFSLRFILCVLEPLCVDIWCMHACVCVRVRMQKPEKGARFPQS